MELWRTEGRFTEVPYARLYEMAALESRDAKRNITREEVTRIFERGFEECGTSFDQVRRELERCRELSISRTAPETSQVVELALRDLTEREAVLDRARLLDQAVVISGGEHSLAERNVAIDGGTPEVQRLGRDTGRREFYTTREMLELASRNLERIRDLPPLESVARIPEVEMYLERWQEERGVRLTAGQKAEVHLELPGSRGVVLTIGDPRPPRLPPWRSSSASMSRYCAPRGGGIFLSTSPIQGRRPGTLPRTGRPALILDVSKNGNPASEFALQGTNGEPPILVVAGE